MLANNKKEDLANSLIRNQSNNNEERKSGSKEGSEEQESGCFTSCSHYFQEFPYSFFSIRRRQPGQPKAQPRKLKFTYEIPHKFDYLFWNFDTNLIEFIQYFHTQRASPRRKILGHLFEKLSYLIAIAFSLESWIIIMLAFSINQYDAASRWIAHFVLMNCLVTQFCKRFFQRKRPCYYQPPRAFPNDIIAQRSSSLPSRVVVAATTLTYALLTSNLTIQPNESVYNPNGFSVAALVLIPIAAYIVSSFSRVHLGFNYPSDCIIAIPVILLVLGLAHFMAYIEQFFGCQGICDYKVCYNLGDTASDIELNNFKLYDLNFAQTMTYIVIGTAVFGVLTAYPLEFWRKTSYMFANLLSVYLFHNIMLCPTSDNGYRSAIAPYLNDKDLNDDSFLAAIAYIYLFFSFASTYIVNNLLGRRTGHCLSMTLRTIFFIAFIVQTLTVLILVRLMIVSGNDLTS